MSKKKTKEEFEKQANQIHNHRYNYSKVNYISNRVKVKIICENNHEFEQTPNAHLLLKQGCPYCSKRVKHTNESFIEKAKNVHGDKYDYTLLKYINAKTKVKIICSIHGVFEQIARNHINSKQGCTECGKEVNGWSKQNFKNLCIKNNKRYWNSLYNKML